MGLMPHPEFGEILHTAESSIASGTSRHQNYAPPLKTPH
jgi:hypothetical protein